MHHFMLVVSDLIIVVTAAQKRHDQKWLVMSVFIEDADVANFDNVGMGEGRVFGALLLKELERGRHRY